MDITSEPGHGTQVTITLPGNRERADGPDRRRQSHRA
jgi:signal transduction histidine kinase